MDDKTLAQLNALCGQGGKGGGDMFISSIRDAQVLLQSHLGPRDAAYRAKLIDYITDPANQVFSEPNVYHNIVMDLCRNGDYALALKLCDFALTRSPKNCDMLGDALHACADSTRFEEGERYLARAMEIKKDRWSWRLFFYSADFMERRLEADPNNDAYFEQAYALSQEYIDYYPCDEHGYSKQAEILLCVNRRDEAIDKLIEFIQDTHPDKKDHDSSLVCAQCCVTLLELLDDSSDYDLIAQIADRGMRDSTQSQPSAKIGFFMYKKALALDALAHKQKFEVPSTVQAAVSSYQVAYDLNQDRSYAKTIEQRYALLRIHVRNCPPLVKRPLFVTESPNAPERDS